MTVNAANLDKARHTMVFRKTKEGGLVDLHYDIVSIDGDTFYQPVWPGRRLENGAVQKGIFTAPLIMNSNTELPIPASPKEGTGRGRFGAWYYGDGD